MIDITEKINPTLNPSTLFSLKNNLLGIFTKKQPIKIINNIDFKVLNSYENDFLNEDIKEACFSKNGALFAFIANDTIHILDLNDKKIINTIEIKDEVVDSICFDPTSRYLIVKTQSAKIFQYLYNSHVVLAKLYEFEQKEKHYNKQKDLFNLCFYENKFACSYNNAIFTCDLYIHIDEVITQGNSYINSLNFIDKDTIIFSNDNAEIKVVSIKEKKLIKHINTAFSNIKEILPIKQGNFALINSQTKDIALLDLNTYKIISPKYISFKNKIQNILLINDNEILIKKQNNKVIKITLTNTDELKSLLLHNSLDKAYKLIEKQPLLKYSNEEKKLESLYEKNFLKAIDELQNTNKKLALELTDMFKDIASKKVEIFLLFKGFENYDRFKEICINKKYSLIYAMSSKYPALQKTNEFKLIQKDWREIFLHVHKQLLIDKNSDIKEILNDFITVSSKRVLIKLITTNTQMYIKFLKAIKEKDFKTLDKILEANKDFNEVPTYMTFLQDTQKDIQSIKIQLSKNKLDLAKQNLKKFKKQNASQEILNLFSTCKDYAKLQKAYDKKEYKTCYELVDSNVELKTNKLAKTLEKEWIKTIHTCQKSAISANIEEIKKHLGDLVNITSRKNIIQNLLKASFYSRLNLLTKLEKNSEAKDIINSYIDVFGMDNEIQNIIKDFESKTNTRLNITH